MQVKDIMTKEPRTCILSMNDIILAAGAGGRLRDDEVADAFQGICGHHHPAPHVAAA